jgi:hypothetical protein
VHDHLGTAAEHVVGHRVHVADDQVGCVARLHQRVGTAVDADEHRLELPDVRPEHVEIGLVVVSAHDDEAVPAGDVGLDLRHADTVEQQVTLLLEVLHRVGRERLQLHRQPLAGVGHRLRDALQILPHAVCDRLAVDIHRVVVDTDGVTLAHLLENALAEVVDQRDARLHEDLGPKIGVSPGNGRLRVEHRRHTDRDQRIRGDPIEVDVVDHGDVAWTQPARQTLGPAVEARGAGYVSRFDAPGPAQGW